MDPVKGNSLNKSCGDVVSSNCVIWAGGAVSGVCGPNPSLTQVVQSAIDKSGDCCKGSFPAGNQSCYTGTWVDFSSSIPLSGAGTGYTYSLVASIPPYNTPSYKWTQQGDLKIRGAVQLTISPSVTRSGFSIPLVTLPSTCFPTGYSGAHFAITAVDVVGTSINAVTAVESMGLYLNYPTPTLSIEGGFINTLLVPMTLTVAFGSTTFNLA